MKLRALLKLIRPLNSFMIGLAVIVGNIVSRGVFEPTRALFGFSTGFLISSFSMVTNDYFDLEVDRINAPNKPLVRGDVSVFEAKVFALLILLAGIFFSTLTGLNTFLLALTFSFLSFLYNFKLKEYGILGNFIVATSMAVPFIYGALMVGEVNLVVLSLALTAFFAGIGREIVKNIIDVEGDKVRNAKTIPILYGEGFAGRLGAFFFILAVTSSFLPVILKEVGLMYIVFIGATDMLFIVLAFLISLNPTKSRAYFVKKVALYGMLLGIIGYMVEGLSS